MSKKFRHTAGFGKRMEYWIIGKMLRENLDVYVPLVDDFGIDAVIRKKDGEFIEVQIKARSDGVAPGDAALFAAITHPEFRKNYYFIFYSERLDTMWILSSEEFIKEAVQNKNGKNRGKRSIWFNGKRKNKSTNQIEEHAYTKFDKYKCQNFDVFKKAGAIEVVIQDLPDSE
jgi:hypothetical protein